MEMAISSGALVSNSVFLSPSAHVHTHRVSDLLSYIVELDSKF